MTRDGDRGGDGGGGRERKPRDDDDDGNRGRDTPTAAAAADDDDRRPPKREKAAKDKSKDKPPREKKPAAPPGGGEEMILVFVNDRLGTKAQIPCFPSDRVREFKILVAARIGREPHEILLKRQGERPFKDQLTLEDYGVSNGVQLDLEVDTGD